MLRRIACAVVIVGISLTLAAAEEIKGTILSVAEGKVTVRLKAKEKGMKGEEKTFTLADKVKVSKKEEDKVTEVEGGVASSLIKNIDPKKGAKGMIITNTDNKVTEIVITAKKKE